MQLTNSPPMSSVISCNRQDLKLGLVTSQSWYDTPQKQISVWCMYVVGFKFKGFRYLSATNIWSYNCFLASVRRALLANIVRAQSSANARSIRCIAFWVNANSSLMFFAALSRVWIVYYRWTARRDSHHPRGVYPFHFSQGLSWCLISFHVSSYGKGWCLAHALHLKLFLNNVLLNDSIRF